MTATCSRTQALANRLTIGLRAGLERDVYYRGLPLRTAWQWSRRIYWLMSSEDGVPTKWADTSRQVRTCNMPSECQRRADGIP
jgi:hypothetical protein